MKKAQDKMKQRFEWKRLETKNMRRDGSDSMVFYQQNVEKLSMEE